MGFNYTNGPAQLLLGPPLIASASGEPSGTLFQPAVGTSYLVISGGSVKSGGGSGGCAISLNNGTYGMVINTPTSANVVSPILITPFIINNTNYLSWNSNDSSVSTHWVFMFQIL